MGASPLHVCGPKVPSIVKRCNQTSLSEFHGRISWQDFVAEFRLEPVPGNNYLEFTENMRINRVTSPSDLPRNAG